jgi:hypothetical protein
MRFVTRQELKTKYGIPHSATHLIRLEKLRRFPRRLRLNPMVNRLGRPTGKVVYLVERIESYQEAVLAGRPYVDPE